MGHVSTVSGLWGGFPAGLPTQQRASNLTPRPPSVFALSRTQSTKGLNAFPWDSITESKT